MKDEILEKLEELERNERIHVLYACESGSRAWGFASPDSDYDVRFIYTRPGVDYLRIHETQDYTGLPVDEVLDVSGWDIRKTLKLFQKSNGPLYEWLQSPIIYRQHTDFADELRKLMPTYFNLRAGGHHYLSMARKTLVEDLAGNQVKLKRYFYALRPVLACLWIVDRREVPPMEFGILRQLITDNGIQREVDELLEQKANAAESAMIEPVAVLNHWLLDVTSRCKEAVPTLDDKRLGAEELDGLFRKYLL